MTSRVAAPFAFRRAGAPQAGSGAAVPLHVPAVQASAAVQRLRDQLAGKTVGIVLSGANIDQATLRDILG